MKFRFCPKVCKTLKTGTFKRIKQVEPSQQKRPVSKWTNHEHYHSGNIQNDIAVIEHGIFYETDRVRPIQGVVI